jgi:hypothetical protein
MKTVALCVFALVFVFQVTSSQQSRHKHPAPDTSLGHSGTQAPTANPAQAQHVIVDSAPSQHVVIDSLPFTAPSENEKDDWAKASSIAQILLVIVGALSFGAVWYQAVKTREAAEATRQSASETQKATVATEKAAAATEQAAEATQKAAAATEASIAEIKKQVEIMERQAQILEESVTVSKSSVDASNRNTETQANIERAWLLPTAGSIEPRILPQMSDYPIPFSFTIRNFGRTPAWIVAFNLQIDFLPVEKPADTYNTESEIKYPYAKPLTPNETIELTEYWKATVSDIKSVRDGKNFLYARGYVQYTTLVSHQPSSSYFCYQYRRRTKIGGAVEELWLARPLEANRYS